MATAVTFTYCFTALRLLFVKPHLDSASVFGQRGNMTELSKLLNATQQILGRTRLWSFGARLAERCLLVDDSQCCSCRNNSFSSQGEEPWENAGFPVRYGAMGGERQLRSRTRNKSIRCDLFLPAHRA